MSQTFYLDTTSYQVGTQIVLPVIIPLVSTPAIGQRYPRAVINNESGCGLDITLSGGRNFTMPAGGWTKPFNVYQNDSQLNILVKYVLPSSPVNQFSITIYKPDEEVILPSTLGNSPIGISGSVNTTAGKTLQDDSDNPGTQFIEATPTDQTASAWAMNNDASGYLQILSNGALKKIWNFVRGSATSAATLTIGDSSAIDELTIYATLGTGSIVPTSTLSGTISATSITGTIPASQIGSGYPAGNITGTLPASQVGSGYPAGNLSGTISAADIGAGTLSGTFIFNTMPDVEIVDNTVEDTNLIYMQRTGAHTGKYFWTDLYHGGVGLWDAVNSEYIANFNNAGPTRTVFWDSGGVVRLAGTFIGTSTPGAPQEGDLWIKR